MAHQVRIQQHPVPLTVAANETILEAALAAGVDYPCGCQSGNCGSCKSRLIAGAVELSPYSETALTEDERAAGYVLACRAVPKSDVVIAWVEPDEAVTHAQRRLDCRVAGIADATHDIRILRLCIDAGGPFDYAAGQYAAVGFDGLPPRDFSMASPAGGRELEFHVRAVAGGTVSAYVRRALKVGDRVRVEGPHGTAYLRESHRGPILALAGGSGLAPIKAIVERALAIALPQPIHLYFGVRDERDLYLEDHFRRLAATHPNVSFVPVLSEPSAPTRRRVGFLADAVAADFRDLDGAKAYIAGPPVMVETCAAAVQRLGVRSQDCHADAFYTEADKRKLEQPA